jgi:hypothetical protein
MDAQCQDISTILSKDGPQVRKIMTFEKSWINLMTFSLCPLTIYLISLPPISVDYLPYSPSPHCGGKPGWGGFILHPKMFFYARCFTPTLALPHRWGGNNVQSCPSMISVNKQARLTPNGVALLKADEIVDTLHAFH